MWHLLAYQFSNGQTMVVMYIWWSYRTRWSGMLIYLRKSVYFLVLISRWIRKAALTHIVIPRTFIRSYCYFVDLILLCAKYPTFLTVAAVIWCWAIFSSCTVQKLVKNFKIWRRMHLIASDWADAPVPLFSSVDPYWFDYGTLAVTNFLMTLQAHCILLLLSSEFRTVRFKQQILALSRRACEKVCWISTN